MRTKLFALCLFTLCLAAGGCAGKPLDHHEYLLRPPPPDERPQPAGVVLLTRVEVPHYLDQKGIVLQTSDVEIHAGRQHVWAEPLDEAIIRFLQVTIARAGDLVVEVAPLSSGRPATEITVQVHQLHGSMDGAVRLVADWSAVKPGESVSLFHFDSTIRQAADGYAALVDAHGALLTELGRAMAREL